MDIKLKSSHKKFKLVIIVLIVFTIGTMLFFPGIIRRGEANFAAYKDAQGMSLDLADSEVLSNIYSGCYVLYQEAKERESGKEIKGSELFIEYYLKNEDDYTQEQIDLCVDEILDSWESLFETYREYIDYYVAGDGGDSNTSRPLEKAISDISDSDLISYYKAVFAVEFNENGAMEVEIYYVDIDEQKDVIIKELGKIDRSDPLATTCYQYYGDYSEFVKVKKPQDITIIFAIPKKNIYTHYDNLGGYWAKMDSYNKAGASFLYVMALLLLALFVVYMGSKNIWKDDVMVNRPGNWYLMEAAIIGVIFVIAMMDSFVQMIWYADYCSSFSDLFYTVLNVGIYEALVPVLYTVCLLLFVYTVWYASLSFIRPVFSLGIREYIRQYCLIYQIFPWMKKKWNQLVDEIHHIDLTKKSTATIFKIVLINFVILLIVSLSWFFGIFIYSLFLFYILKRNYDKIRKDYQILLKGVNHIAEGDLNTAITEDLGMFEPFRDELCKIRTGFKKAVDDEVKSQKMKTELITNVSHDLKTPLTAITTYVELLKKKDITEEERQSYIETLEKKSLRLKILIEDLFEISKVSSNNIVLDLREIDVVNLIKQVSIEHADKFEQQGLDLRWSLPDKKVTACLDNQKTYRIFENLFGNISKYAMHDSRVYVDIRIMGSQSEITIKNISAMELNIGEEEITERFVRGDISRNTEGSGLGLAIAKSLTEAQGGRFRVEIDGDLFKVIIGFPVM